ncbi:MAG TPA: enoyl-CoA hydratase/isomerase family protein [Roseiflexaceae bacterium]|nr:enoyl-CoA hydratase/isomerase family protein [Roseiflexaceae bacterium]
MNYSDYQHLVFERREHGVLWITMNRPDVLNAADRTLHTELVQIWKTVDADPSVGAVVITGAGRAFSAGGDLQMVAEAHGNFEEIARLLEEARELVYNMLHCNKPVVSAINGAAVGAGLVVALLADISIASDQARLGDGHIRLGVAAGDHAAVVWPLLCGMAKAKYYLLTGELVGGVEAERIGLVSMCVPHAELEGRALETAVKLAAGPRYAIKYTKRALNQWMLQAGPIFDHSAALEMLNFFSPDLGAGLEGLRRREPPRFPSSRPAQEE